jgi:hypothetical protein
MRVFPGNYQGKSITSPKCKRQTENQRQTRCVNCSASGSYPAQGPAFQSRTRTNPVNGARVSLILDFREKWADFGTGPTGIPVGPRQGPAYSWHRPTLRRRQRASGRIAEGRLPDLPVFGQGLQHCWAAIRHWITPSILGTQSNFHSSKDLASSFSLTKSGARFAISFFRLRFSLHPLQVGSFFSNRETVAVEAARILQRRGCWPRSAKRYAPIVAWAVGCAWRGRLSMSAGFAGWSRPRQTSAAFVPKEPS